MCGICGFISKQNITRDELHAMNETMIHRGPDDGGVEIYPMKQGYSIGLAQRRLAILDLSSLGHQPMHSADGRVSVVYNGEIYNFRQIREELKGYPFISDCDTEVIIAAYLKWGISCVDHFNGMFAICLYDREGDIVYLIRDRIGKKPLYYEIEDGNLYFGSELKPLMKRPGFREEIRTDVLPRFLYQQYIAEPDTIFKNVYKLRPGEILSFCYGEVKTWKYWDIKKVYHEMKQKPVRDYAEAKETLKELLKESVKKRMIADVPLGAFLSGGYDSSLMTAIAQEISDTPVKTFTIGFPVEHYNEAEYAKEVAEFLGTDHTDLYIDEARMFDLVSSIPVYYDEPFADSSQIPTYLVSRMTREHVTVSLSGDGGDELFCGYNSYMSVDRLWNRIRQVPYGIRKLAGELVLHSPLANKETYRVKGTLLGARGASDLYRLSMEREPIIRKIALSKKELPYKYTEYDPEFLRETNHNIMLMDMLMYHPDDILVKVDRTAMAVSLETRVPMLDKDVVEFAWTLPVEFERQNGVGKRILRDVLYRYVPKEMMERPKKGFSIPIQKWLKEKELREWAENLIDRKTLCQQGILNPDVVWKMWTDFIEKDEWRIQIWYVLIFQEWMSYVL